MKQTITPNFEDYKNTKEGFEVDQYGNQTLTTTDSSWFARGSWWYINPYRRFESFILDEDSEKIYHRYEFQF